MTTHHPTRLVRRRFQVFSFLVLTCMLLSACGGKSAALQAEPTATLPPPATATATTAPTDTPTPVPTDTATPTSTPTPDKTATAAVEATKSAEEALAKIAPELEKVGVHSGDGQLVWSQTESTSLTTENYWGYDYDKIDDAGSLADFVFHSEIGWNTTSGLGGCGLIFRAEDDFVDGGYYHLWLVRLQSAPAWLVEFMKFNKVQVEVNGNDVYSNAILDKPDSVNKVTIVARGKDIFTNINGEKLRQLESTKQLEGKLGFMVLQESGKSQCTFTNSWAYSLK